MSERGYSRQLLVAGGVLIALCGALYLARKPSEPAPPRAEEGPLKLDISAGIRAVYSFAWEGKSSMRWAAPPPTRDIPVPMPSAMPVSQLEGDVELTGKLHIDGHGAAPTGGFRVALQIESLSACALHVVGRTVFESRDACEQELIKHPVYVDLRADGRVERLHTPKEMSPSAMHTLQSLVQRFDTLLQQREAKTWEIDEPGPSGKAHSVYSRDGADAVQRIRKRYVLLTSVPSSMQSLSQSLTSSSQIKVSEGFWLSIRDEEKLQLTDAKGSNQASSEQHFNAERIELTTGESESIAVSSEAYVSRGLDDQSATTDLDRRHLESRAADTTIDSVRQGLGVPSNGGSNHEWFSRSAAFLRLHPEQCNALVGDFSTLSEATQPMFVDLLSVVGHPTCQGAIRKVLGESTGKLSDVRLADMVQRMTKIDRPDVETIAFVRGLLSKNDSMPLREAAALTLGALIHNGARAGVDVGEAAGALREGLRKAKTPTDKAMFLDGLGNAGLTSEVGTVVKYARDDDPRVRATAAEALRFTATPEAQKTLVGLSADPDGGVQSAALKSLTEQPPDAAVLGSIEQLVNAQQIRQEAGPALLDFLIAGRGTDPSVTRMLERMADDEHLSNQIRASARQLRARANP